MVRRKGDWDAEAVIIAKEEGVGELQLLVVRSPAVKVAGNPRAARDNSRSPMMIQSLSYSIRIDKFCMWLYQCRCRYVV